MISFTVNEKNIPFLTDLYNVLKKYCSPEEVKNSYGSSLQAFVFEDDKVEIVFALDNWENIKAVWLE